MRLKIMDSPFRLEMRRDLMLTHLMSHSEVALRVSIFARFEGNGHKVGKVYCDVAVAFSEKTDFLKGNLF